MSNIVQHQHDNQRNTSGLTTVRTLIQRCQSSLSFSSESSSKKFYKEHCIYLPAMLGWFTFSIVLSLYNKWVFGDDHLAFPCPLLMTSVHFLCQWGFSYLLSSRYPITLGGDQVSSMSWKYFLGIAIPCGLVTSMDVGFSNLALVRISISFYTMVKASSPIFVILSAYLFGIEKITLSLILVVTVITMGEFLTVLGEVSRFDLLGFIFCLIASVLAGMRWTIVQLKIQSIEPKLKSTIATMRILSPFMFLSMLIISCIKERPWSSDSHLSEWLDTYDRLMFTLGLSMLGATLAICMIICEFYLIMKSNAIVLMIGGVLKEMNTIMFGIIVFGDTLNIVNVMGCIVVFAGVILYKLSLHVKKLETKYDDLLRSPSGSSDDTLIVDDDGIGIGAGPGGGAGGSDLYLEEAATQRSNNCDIHDSPTRYKAKQDEATVIDRHDVFVINDDEDDHMNRTEGLRNLNRK